MPSRKEQQGLFAPVMQVIAGGLHVLVNLRPGSGLHDHC